MPVQIDGCPEPVRVLQLPRCAGQPSPPRGFLSRGGSAVASLPASPQSTTSAAVAPLRSDRAALDTPCPDTAPVFVTGTMIVSTPETTAFDLVRFPAASGYWSQVATVLAELVERLDAARLVGGAARVARSDVQRLGWLLDFIGRPALADALADALSGHRLVPVRLNSRRDAGGAVRDRRWNVLVNDQVEPDP